MKAGRRLGKEQELAVHLIRVDLKDVCISVAADGPD
jgi:hypothetical protein